MTWNYAYTPLIWPMLVSAIFSAAIAVYAWRHRTVPGAASFAIQELFIALWALFTAMEMAATTTPTKILHHKLEAAAAVTGMSAMFYFALERASPGKWATRRTALLLSLVTLGLIILMATDDLHHLLWTRFWFDQFIRVERGPLNLLLLGWALLLPALSLLVFFFLLRRSGGIFRRQALMLFIGAALPLFTFFLEPAGINPVAPLDPVILMMNVSSLLYALAIFRFRMLEVVPIGRYTAIERMANGVLILDAENRIVDLNPAAREVLALSRGTIGRPVGQALVAYPDLSRLLEQKTIASIEIVLYRANQPRYFQVQASPLNHPGGFYLGRLILLQDVTDQRQAQAQIIEQQRALAMLNERERLARELHDNLGQVFAFVNAQGQAIRRLLARGEISKAEEYVSRLVGVAQEADADVRESILSLRVTPNGQGFFSTLGQYLERYEKNYEIHIELHRPETLVETIFDPQVEVQLLRILQEALTNTRKHANARHVQVAFTVQNNCARVTIQDDGHGFDLHDRSTGFGEHVGLLVMRERAEEVGGSFAIQSKPGEGTQVIITVPLRQGVPGIVETT